MEYKTIVKNAIGELVEKKSRFIAYAAPVTTEEEALEFLSAIRKKHWDATHNVYAYVLNENRISRFSDDGEPSGTAGAPVLEIINGAGIADIIVVVTRYFGGTLLGTGGLIRAYSKAAKEALAAAEIVTMAESVIFLVSVPYALWGRLKNIFKETGCVIEQVDFTEEVNARVICEKTHFGKLEKQVSEATLGQTELILEGEVYFGY